MGNTSGNSYNSEPEEESKKTLEKLTKSKKGSGCFGPFIVIFIALGVLTILI